MKTLFKNILPLAAILMVVAFASKSCYVPVMSDVVWSTGIFPKPYQLYLKITDTLKISSKNDAWQMPLGWASVIGDLHLNRGELWTEKHFVTTYEGRGSDNAYLCLAKIVRGHAQDTAEGDYMVFGMRAGSDPDGDYVAISGWYEEYTAYLRNGEYLGGSSSRVKAGKTVYGDIVSENDHDAVQALRRRATTVVSYVYPEDMSVWPVMESLMPSRSGF